MIKPIRNNVLVKCLEKNDKTEAGLLLPTALMPDSNRVEVIDVGVGTPNKPMRLKAGDIGYRVKDWGQEIEGDGQKYYLMDSSAIIALQ